MNFTVFTVEDTALAWQKSTGGRGADYHLPGEAIPTPEDIFGTAPAISAPSSPHLTGSPPHLTGSFPHLTGSSPHLNGSSPHLNGSSPDLDGRGNAEGCRLSDWLPIGKSDTECYVTESVP